MASTQATEGDGFKIWGVDGVVYGPVELPILVGWVKEERVTATTWVYTERDDAWHKASDIPELFMFFRPKESSEPTTQVVRDPSVAGLKAGSLRRVKIFADLTEEQLERFVAFMEIERVRQWAEIVKQGEQGDAMYLVVEGELRVRMMIGGKESTCCAASRRIGMRSWPARMWPCSKPLGWTIRISDSVITVSIPKGVNRASSGFTNS